MEEGRTRASDATASAKERIEPAMQDRPEREKAVPDVEEGQHHAPKVLSTSCFAAIPLVLLLRNVKLAGGRPG